MKKFLLALTAVAAFAGSAVAADLPARTYSKGPPPAMPVPVATWTGCYINGGGGYGLWDQENTNVDALTGIPVTLTATTGGKGYLGTIGGGCDYQFQLAGFNLLIGGFADYDWDSIKGQHATPSPGGFAVANENMSSAWAAGGRLGIVVFPQLMTYFTAGYTEGTFDRQNFFNFPGSPAGFFLDKHKYSGYFIGGGDEYAISMFPGLFWRSEYRLSQFDTARLPFLNVSGLPNSFSDDSKKWVQTFRTELVWRFNWGKGPVVAKY